MSFQLFDDSSQKRKELIHNLNGKFSKYLGLIADLNDQGAGVFVTVNETDGLGRREANVVGIRALFIDHDFKAGNLLQEIALPPSIVVASGGGRHYYWLLEPKQDKARFTDAQSRLIAYYGSDQSVKDLPRVMRVPGFFHRKGDPKLTTLDECHPERRYTIDEILAVHPATVVELPTPAAATQTPAVRAGDDRIKRCVAYMAERDPAIQGSGGDDWTLQTAMVGGDFDLSEGEFWPILCDWNARCSPPWGDDELRDKLRNADKYRKNPRGNKLVDRHPERAPRAKKPAAAETIDPDSEPAKALASCRQSLNSGVEPDRILEWVATHDSEILRELMIIEIVRKTKIPKKTAREAVGRERRRIVPPPPAFVDATYNISIDPTRWHLSAVGVFPIRPKDGSFVIDHRNPVATRPIWPDRLGRDRAVGGLSVRLNWETPRGAIVQEWMQTRAFADREALRSLDGAPVSLGRIAELSDFLQDSLTGIVTDHGELASRLVWVDDDQINARGGNHDAAD